MRNPRVRKKYPRTITIVKRNGKIEICITSGWGHVIKENWSIEQALPNSSKDTHESLRRLLEK